VTALHELIQPCEGRPHLVVVIGKGGVGKTTASLLLGHSLAGIGRTLVLSLDPARHLARYVGRGGGGAGRGGAPGGQPGRQAAGYGGGDC